jgi:hypothetical protein
MGWETVFIGRAVNIDLRWDVEYDGFLLADTFPPMIDSMGHLNQQRIVDSNEELIDLPLGRRTFSRVV